MVGGVGRGEVGMGTRVSVDDVRLRDGMVG